MKKKGHTAEQIIGKLREAEVLLGHGSTVSEVSRKVRATEQMEAGVRKWRRTKEYEVGQLRLGSSFCSAARMHQIENKLQDIVLQLIEIIGAGEWI